MTKFSVSVFCDFAVFDMCVCVYVYNMYIYIYKNLY